MFNFLKRKSRKRLTEHIALVKQICQLLPEKYNYLVSQLNDGIITDVHTGDEAHVNYKRFSLDVYLLNKHEQKSGRCFVIKGTRVFDTRLNSDVDVDLDVAYGLLLGYFCPSVAEIQADLGRVNVRSYYIEYYGEDDFKKCKSMFTPAELKLINPADVYEIEIGEKVYYHIIEQEDGDFIGVDKDKNVYKITHDPFEINGVDKSLLQILSSHWPATVR
jgi:hypothetical protein